MTPTRTPRTGLLRNSLANWAAYLLVAVANFFLSPFVVHHLGNTGYGIWVLMGSIVGYLGLFDLGVRSAVARFVASHHASHDHHATSLTVVAALRLFSGLALLAFAVGSVLALLADRFFEIPAPMIPVARTVILVGSVTIGVSFISGVFGGVIAGLQRFDIDSGLEVGFAALRVLIVVVALRAGAGLLGLVTIQFGLTTLRGLAAYLVCRQLYPELSLRPGHPVGPSTRALLSFGLITSVLHLSTQIILYTDVVIIGALLPVVMVTFYAISTNLAEHARNLAGTVARIITPRASAAQANQGMDSAADVLLQAARWTSFVTVPVAVTFILRGERFITLWMGSDYGPISGPLIMILAVTVWLSGGHMVSASALMGVNKHSGLTIAFVGEAVLNLWLSLALVGPLGLAGVAIGTVIPSLLVNLGYLPWYLKRSLGIEPRVFAHHAWIKPTLATGPFALATHLVERLWSADSLAVFALQVLVLLPLVALAVYVVGVPPNERSRISSLVQEACAGLWRRAVRS